MALQRSRFARARVLMLGASQVGKTAFAVRYLTRRFIGEYDPNKEVTYNQRITVEKDEVYIEILDTANDMEESVLESHMRWADGCVFIYSVTDQTSYRKLFNYQSLLEKTRNSMDEPPCGVIVANKIDQDRARMVTEEEGHVLAQNLGCPLYELSTAESPDGVMEAMNELLRQIKRDFVKSQSSLRLGPFNSVKRVLKRKITRSRSDTF